MFGRFVVLDLLGRGGMGVVMEAHDPELDRKVALKLLNPDTAAGDGARLRLQQEAQAMAQLAHPNVVAVYEVGRAAAQLFITMELVDGTTLKTWLAEPRGWREVVAMFVAAGRGLEAAHRAGLVHRDFKPENVLIGRDGRPRVSDFGLAARELAAADPALAPAGTPLYMAPEQWSGGAVDARSDQFSFCAALWRAVWGEGPFAGNRTEALRAAVLAGELRTPTRRGVPRWLGRALVRGLALDPGARWPGLGELLDAIESQEGAKGRAGAVVVIDEAPQIKNGELADRLGLRVPRAVRGVRITPSPCPPWKPPAETPLTAAVVAALYGVSVQRVHQLDALCGRSVARAERASTPPPMWSASPQNALLRESDYARRAGPARWRSTRALTGRRGPGR